MCPELHGFSNPLSPKGKARAVGALPWYYSTSLINIRYKADLKEIKKLHPEPFDVSETEPDVVSCLFLSHLSFCEEDKDLLVTNPELAQYKECGINVRCRFKGAEANRTPYIWVDKDWTAFRGWFYGYPKKMGRIELAFDKPHLYALNKALGKIGPGTRFGAFLEAHGERLVTAAVKLTRQITPKELPASYPTYNINHWPSLDVNSKKPLVHRVETDLGESNMLGEVWAAEPESLVFTDSAFEEIGAIKPLKLIDAYYMTAGHVMTGTKVAHQY
jgi:acetoacetate decarboxylase